MGYSKVRDGFDDVETLPLIEVGDSAKVQVDTEDQNEDDDYFENEFNEVWGIVKRLTSVYIGILGVTIFLNVFLRWNY